jgi:catechol 2,3-dioxygenase-like lactoylglutathione lyase family enzyme
MTVRGTIGGAHHVASVVPDVEAAAHFQEDVFGWQRLSDETMTGAQAAMFGRIIGAADVTEFHAVMLSPPGDHRAGLVEFVQLTTGRGPGHLVLPGLFVTCYRVRSVPDAWASLMDAGAQGVQPPVELALGGWRMRAATARVPGGSLIEVIEFLPAP